MAREQRYKAIILKKQLLGEGDELISCFTQENGKIRCVAKSSKFSRSKLQYALQVLFEVQLTASGRGSLPTVTGSEIIQSFPRIRESLARTKLAFYVLELLLKFTADEQKNEQLFELVENYLGFLDMAAEDEMVFNLGLAKFKIDFADAVGLGLKTETEAQAVGELYFSNSRGGFVTSSQTVDSIPVAPETFRQFSELSRLQIGKLLRSEELPEALGEANTIELHEVLSGFLKYHLEREIKSEKYIDLH